MWKLIPFILLFIFLPQKKKNTTIIILNDCVKWEQRFQGKYDQHFTYSTNIDNIGLVGFIYGWIDEADRLSTKLLTYPEILKSEHLYTSELTMDDWYELSLDSGPRIFILKPKDYCSTNRFAYGYQFTLYEVNLSVSRKDDEVMDEIIIHPIPAVDTLRRKKNNWR